MDDLLVSYGLASTCGPCIDSACTSEVAQCNSSCTCPAAIVGFVQCVSLGASTSTCASVASSQTEPSLVLGFYMCASSCTSQCHMVQDAGDDGGDAAASDAAGPGDGGEPDADAGGEGGK